ncbi:uncharacterized protein LOC143688296 [Tamandua tetradactyla]|uniref:uncharacterized protein LOC143688296 n=1 Tax=Tamandua tetradactyla TaxID=48850 RepID=UPI004053AB3D
MEMWKLWLQLHENGKLEKEAVGTTRLGEQQQVFPQPCLPDQCGVDMESQEKRIYSSQWDWLLAVINGSISADPGSWNMCPDPQGTPGHVFFPNSCLAQLWINQYKEKLNKHFMGPFLKVLQIQNHMPFRGSCMLLSRQKPMIQILLPPDPEENSQEEPVVHNRDSQETVESTSKVKPLEGEDDSPAVPAPSSLDASLLAPEQPRILEAITHLGPLGLVLAKAPLSPRGFQRTLLLQACLQLPPCSPSRFAINRGQFRQDGVTSIRARPQASINLYMKKSPLSHARTIPEAREAAQGFNLIQNEKFCPLDF